jgi:hypothetical protein
MIRRDYNTVFSDAFFASVGLSARANKLGSIHFINLSIFVFIFVSFSTEIIDRKTCLGTCKAHLFRTIRTQHLSA